MAKGVPTARSQSYKATHKAKEKIISTSSTSSNDALPLLISISEKPITQADGAQRAFSTVRVLHQSLLHAASPGTHPYDLLQVMASYIFDCSEWYRESEVRNLTLQQQLDDSNAKLLEQFNVQNAEILKLQVQLKTSQAAQDFYRHQALQADMVPPRRRCRFLLPTADNALSPAQIYQQLLLARDDIQVRDRALERLQLKLTQLESSFQQLLTSSSELISLHVTMLEQTMIQFSACTSKLLVADTHSKQLDGQLRQLHSEHHQLVAQVKNDDSILRDLIPSLAPHFDRLSRVTGDSDLHTLVDQLLRQRPHLRPPNYYECKQPLYRGYYG
jgi:hypothetical protein